MAIANKVNVNANAVSPSNIKCEKKYVPPPVDWSILDMVNCERNISRPIPHDYKWWSGVRINAIDPFIRQEIQNILEKAPQLIIDISLLDINSELKGNFFIRFMGLPKQIADERYCILVRDCLFSFHFFPRGISTRAELHVMHDPRKFRFVKFGFGWIPKTFEENTGWGLDKFLYSSAIFTPAAQDQYVQGFSIINEDNQILYSECHIPAAFTDKERKSLIRECLIRGSGYFDRENVCPAAANSATLSPAKNSKSLPNYPLSCLTRLLHEKYGE